METTTELENTRVNIKFRLSALWTSVTLCYLYGDYFELYVPQKVEGMLNGENLLDSPGKLFAATAALAIPALMVFLSMQLRPSFSRILNIVTGLFFTVVTLLIAFTSIAPWRAFYVFLAITESVLTALIVWYAVKWPRSRKE